MLLAVLTIICVLLAGLGGALPGLLPACGVAAAALLPFSRPAVHSDAPVFVRRLWLAGAVGLLWLLLTALPLPGCLAWLAGQSRGSHYATAEQAIVNLRALENARVNAAAADRPGTAAVLTALPSTPLARRLSLNVPGTLRFLLLAAGAWAVFWVTAASGLRARTRFLQALVLLGALVMVLGICGKYLAPVRALWPWQLLAESGGPQSLWPFINRNHFAAFGAMLAPVALCLVLRPGLCQRSGPRPLGASLLFLTAFSLLVAGVFLSLSRGGSAAMLAGVLLTVLFWVRGHRAGTATLAALLGGGMLLGLLFLPAADLQERLATVRGVATDRSKTTRVQNWLDAVGMWRDLPLAGVGMEGFRTVFQLYRRTPGVSSTRFAENEYVQLLADGGLFALTFAGLLAACYLPCFRPLRPGGGAATPGDTPSATEGLASTGCHGLPGQRALAMETCGGSGGTPDSTAAAAGSAAGVAEDSAGNTERVGERPGISRDCEREARRGWHSSCRGNQNESPSDPAQPGLPARSARGRAPAGAAGELSCLDGTYARPPSALLVAVLGTATVIGLHAGVDFALRLPANAFVAAAVLGTAMPLPARPDASGHACPPLSSRLLLWHAPALLLLGAILWLANTVGDTATHLDRDTVLRETSRAGLAQALALAPTYWAAWHELGRDTFAQEPAAVRPVTAAAAPWTQPWPAGHWFVSLWDGGPPPAAAPPPAPATGTEARMAFSESCFARAAACNPGDYRTWWALALVQAARHGLPAAAGSIERVARLAPDQAPALRRQCAGSGKGKAEIGKAESGN